MSMRMNVKTEGIPDVTGCPRWAWRSVKGTVALVSTLLLLIALPLAVRAATSIESIEPQPPDPIQEAQRLVNQAIAILTNPALTLTEERRQIHAMSAPYFDFPGMSRSALGYHWNEITVEQREEFTKLFGAFIEDAYLTKIQDYSGQSIKFIKQQTIAPGYVQVYAEVIHNGPQPIPFTFTLKLIDGTWKIYDGAVHNISVIANYRNQFNRMINNDGFPVLMEQLRKKQENLDEILGERH